MTNHHGQFAQFAAAVVRQLPSDLDETTMQGWIENQEALASALREVLVPTSSLEPTFDFDRRKDGWDLTEDSEPVLKSAGDIARLEIVPFLNAGEQRVVGEELVTRAKKLDANLCQRDLEFLLRNQQHIPESWRNHYLVAPATIWRRPGGPRSVAYLLWKGGRWILCFYWLGSSWGGHARLLRLRKPA